MRLAFALLLLAPASLFEELEQSGRVVGLVDSPSERISPPPLISPGSPPILSFRIFDAKDRGRLGDLGLMTDDAGH